MASYGNIFQFTILSQNGDDVDIFISKKNYSGPLMQRPLGRAPILKREANGNILGTSLEIYAECRIDQEYAGLYTSSADEFLVELYKNRVLQWTGFISPELYAEPDLAPPYDVQIIATDGLGELKNYAFTQEGNRPKSYLGHLRTILQHTGSDLEITTISSLQYSDDEEWSGDLLSIVADFGHLTKDNTYNALQAILASVNATITQQAGKWLIVRSSDIYDHISEMNPVQFGSMNSCDWWPIGNLSTDVIPAKRHLILTSSNAYKPTVLQNSLMESDESWVKEFGARYDDNERAFILPAANSGIVQSVSFEQEVGYQLFLRISARNIGDSQESQVLGVSVKIDGRTYQAGNQFWLTRLAEFDSRYVWRNYEGYIEIDLPEPSASDTRSDASNIDIVIPLYKYDSRSYAYATAVEVRLFNPAGLYDIGIYECSLMQYTQTAGKQIEVAILNNARENANAVELGLGDGDYAFPAAEVFRYALPLGYNSESIIRKWRTSSLTESGYLPLMARDYAVQIAKPRIRYRGKLNVPSSALPNIPLLFQRDNTYYILNTYAYDLLLDEIEVELISIPNATVAIESERVEDIASGAAMSNPSGGSAGGEGSGGGGSTTLAGLDDVKITDLKNDQYLMYDSGIGKWANRNLPDFPLLKGVKIGTEEANVILTWDAENRSLKIDGKAYTTGQFAVGGKATDGSGGGANIMLLTEWDDSLSNLEEYALGANLGKDLRDRIVELENDATQVTVSNLLTTGIKIGTITIDDIPYNFYTPTLATMMGSSAIGNSKNYIYWNGSAWKTQEIPTSLPNPYSLTFGSKTYNGSTPVTITAADLGIIDVDLSKYALKEELDNYLPLAGGTITGDLRLKKTDSDYGSYLYFGDESYCYLYEDSDDHLKIYGRKGINLATSSGSVTINDSTVLTEANLSNYAYTKTSIDSTFLKLTGGTITGRLAVNGQLVGQAISNPIQANVTNKWRFIYANNGIYLQAATSDGNTAGNLYFSGYSGVAANKITFEGLTSEFIGDASISGNATIGGSLTIGGKGIKSLAFKDGLSFSELTSKPTNLDGYGITDAVKNGGYITRDSNSPTVGYATTANGWPYQGAAMMLGTLGAGQLRLIAAIGNGYRPEIFVSGRYLDNESEWARIITDKSIGSHSIELANSAEHRATTDNAAFATYAYADNGWCTAGPALAFPHGGYKGLLNISIGSGDSNPTKMWLSSTRESVTQKWVEVLTDANNGVFYARGRYRELDVNEALAAGVYELWGSSAGHPNSPSGYGTLLTMRGSAQNMYFTSQLLINAQGHLYSRISEGDQPSASTWSDWRTIVDDNNISSYTYTKTSIDSTFLKLTGGTITGRLAVNGQLVGQAISNPIQANVTNKWRFIYANNGIYLQAATSDGNTAGNLYFSGYSGVAANKITFEGLTSEFIGDASISGNATIGGSLTIGGATLSWDSAKQALRISTKAYSVGQVAAGGGV